MVNAQFYFKFLEDLGYGKPEERPEAVYLYKGKY